MYQLWRANDMPQLYIETHWDKFVESIPDEPQGNIGTSPLKWVGSYDLKNVPENLPNRKLGRGEVRSICQENPDVLFGYICAMAWGGQGMTKYVNGAWSKRAVLTKHLEKLREGKLTRCDAYNLFLNDKIFGLGPAYWTKLLFFFGPDEKAKNSCYIMDQWTAKSVNLLTGLQVVKMSGDNVSSDNRCGNYQAFCEVIDSMVTSLQATGLKKFEVLTGAKVEEWIYSRGWEGKEEPLAWRAYVISQSGYRREPLLRKFPHIEEALFVEK
jgi:hypothetical protein